MINVEKNFIEKVQGNNNIAKTVLPIVGQNGDYVEVYGKDAIAAEIRNLLMTPQGLYPFDPEYGTLLYKQLFEPICEDTERKIYYEVKERVLKYVAGVDVTGVDLVWDEQHKTCKVDVYYLIIENKNRTKLSVFIKNLINGDMYSSIDHPVYNDFKF